MSDHSSAHGTVRLYWVFCIVLCVITFLEWIIFKEREAWGVTPNILVPLLMIMSVTKFAMVCGWYMHLRYDHSWLTKIFIAGLVMAVGVGIVLCILMV